VAQLCDEAAAGMVEGGGAEERQGKKNTGQAGKTAGQPV
jgi:hypothetical protein